MAQKWQVYFPKKWHVCGKKWHVHVRTVLHIRIVTRTGYQINPTSAWLVTSTFFGYSDLRPFLPQIQIRGWEGYLHYQAKEYVLGEIRLSWMRNYEWLLATWIGEARLLELEYVAAKITAKAFWWRRKRKAGRRDKGFASMWVMNRLI